MSAAGALPGRHPRARRSVRASSVCAKMREEQYRSQTSARRSGAVLLTILVFVGANVALLLPFDETPVTSKQARVPNRHQGPAAGRRGWPLWWRYRPPKGQPSRSLGPGQPQ